MQGYRSAPRPGVSGLSAEVRGKVITLKGKADSREAANLVMSKIDQAVKADNIVNAIEVKKAPGTGAETAEKRSSRSASTRWSPATPSAPSRRSTTARRATT